MRFTVTTPAGPVLIEAETHALEGRHHVFRTTAYVMGAPRQVVVRRILVTEVQAVHEGDA